MKIVAVALLLAIIGQQAKTQMPPPADLKKAEQQIKDLFAADYAKKTRDDKASLARKFIEHAAKSQNDAAARWILLSEARDLAVDASDLQLAFEAIDAQGSYDVDLKPIRAKAVAGVKKGIRAPEDALRMASFTLRLASSSYSSGSFEDAGNWAKEAEHAARAAKDPGLLGMASARLKEASEAKKEEDKAKQAEAVLKLNAKDADANQTVGWFHCAFRGDWAKGVPFLANGSNDTIRSAAEKDAAAPATVGGSIEVADAWMSIGLKERESLARERVLGHAQRWFESALEKAEGLDRARILKKLDDLDAALGPSGGVNLLKQIDPAKDALNGTWKLTGRAVESSPPQGQLQIPYTVPDEYILSLAVEKASAAALDIKIVLPIGGQQIGVRVSEGESYLFLIDGKQGDLVGAGFKGNPFNAQGSNRIVYGAYRKRLTVEVNGMRIIDWPADYRRVSLPSEWRSSGSPTVHLHNGVAVRIKQVFLQAVTGQGKNLR
jgi:hypothetical protein